MQKDSSLSSGRIRFGEFEVDVRSHELLRSGRKIRLQEKAFLVLHELLERPGEVVTREELAAALWPKEYFVDAEHGLNTAVRRLREALGDSADEARFVETLPKLGYRFIGTIAETPAAAGAPSSAAVTSPSPPPSLNTVSRAPVRSFRRGVLAAAAIVAAVLFILVAALVARFRPAQAKAGAGASAASPEGSDTVDQLLARARYLRNVKRFEDARKFVDEALKLDPRSGDAVAALALSQLAEGNLEQARASARRALELDPKATEAYRALGVLAREAGNLAVAERYFRLSVDADPADVKSRNRLARHLLECGRIDEAKAKILETRQLAPDDPDVQNIWMEYALRTGDFELAIREGESWIAIWGKQIEGQPTPAVRDMLGLAYVGARRHEEAIAQFRAVDPDDDLRLALALGYAGRANEARAVLEAHEKAESAAPGAGAATDSRRTATSGDPGRAGALAMAYIAIGDFDRAFEQLDRQLAARWFPGWLNCALFHSLRSDPRYAEFAHRLEREFFGTEMSESLPAGSRPSQLLQAWPRPAKAAAQP